MTGLKWTVFLAAGLFFIACGHKDKAEMISDIDLAQEPDVVIYDFSDSASTGTMKNWTLKADKAEVYNAQGKTILSNLEVILFKDNRQDGTLTAKWGFITASGKNVSAQTNVFYRSADNFRLYTQSLHWDNIKKKLTTDDFVKIIQPNGDLITGYGLEASQNFSQITIKHRVKGRFNKNEKNSLF